MAPVYDSRRTMTEKEKTEMPFEKFTDWFNNTVYRIRKAKWPSMDFIPGWIYDCPKRWILGAIQSTNVRGYNLYPIERFDKVIGILFLKKPCAKFNQLIGWVDKYCTNGFNTGDIETKLYVADICGKRGVWSPRDEHRKEYLCHNPKWCDRVKKQLQKLRNTGDKVEVFIDTVEDYENLEESIRNETELYGSVLYTLHFKVTTPGGKVKFDGVIY
jgi:hypothetical protein